MAFFSKTGNPDIVKGKIYLLLYTFLKLVILIKVNNVQTFWPSDFTFWNLFFKNKSPDT